MTASDASKSVRKKAATEAALLPVQQGAQDPIDEDELPPSSSTKTSFLHRLGHCSPSSVSNPDMPVPTLLAAALRTKLSTPVPALGSS